MAAVLFSIVALMLVVTAISLIPVELQFAFTRRRRWRGRARVRALFGAVRFDLGSRVDGRRAEEREHAERPGEGGDPDDPSGAEGSAATRADSSAATRANASEPRTSVSRRFRSGRRFARAFGRPALLRRALRLLGRLARSVRVRRLSLAAAIGLDDPAETGRLWGLIGSSHAVMTPLLSGRRDVRLRLEPRFGGPHLAAVGGGDVRVVPARVIGPLLAFVLSPPMIRALWALRPKGGS